MSNKVHIYLAALYLATGLASAPAVSAPVVDPETQPALVLAPYVARNDDLSQGQTNAYRPWFENGSWQGDLIEYTLATDGVRTTDVLVGDNPADGGVTNWSARAQFDAAEDANTTWWQSRAIYSTNGSGLGTRISFLWNELSASQKAALDPEAAADPSLNGAFDSPVLNYLRGDRSQERDQAGGIFRIRYNLLGAIINSTPSYASYPVDGDPYAEERVYVGANDGMLHAFDAKTGDEVWAYVPSMLMPKLSRHGDVPYDIVYMVDGETRYSSAVTGYDDDDNIVRKRILTAGLGAGGKGLFALDVDSPDEPALLWEIHAATSGVGDDIGQIHGRPAVARIGGTLAASAAYVVTGNGFASANGRAVLLRIALDGTVSSIVADAGPENGLGAPTLLDLNNDGLVDYAYAGDLKGNLWRFDLNANSASKVFAAGVSKPITAAPDVARHPFGGIMVYFGTGSVLSMADAANEDQQTIFAIRDLRTGEVSTDDLVAQTLSVESAYEKQLRVATDNVVDYDQVAGWKVDLPVTSERLIGRPQVRGGRLQFVTTITSGDYPAGWLMQLNYLSGASSDTALFDISGDGALDSSDAVTIADVGQKYPVGRYLGDGNFSQPVLLRLRQGIDVSYINGLLLPFAPLVGAELIFGGNIDVTTDSPSGPVVSKVAGYPNPDAIYPAGDGIGNNVDGHVHGYDKLHNVKYVDFFELEPRRGMWRLDAALDGSGDAIAIERELSRVTEVNAPGTGTVGFGNSQKFIVSLTNADLSQGVDLQIGCRTWNAAQYQAMITHQLVNLGRTPSQLQDTYHGNASLIFTIDDILNADCGDTSGTLRLNVVDRVGKDGVLHATLPGCVNDTTNWDGEPKSAGEIWHITPVQESSGNGFRWRNGALTAQLLKVNSDDSSAYTLQGSGQPTYKLRGDTIHGGAYARGFVPTANGRNIDSLITGNQSGLLYELTMFWHHGDMFDFQQSGQPPKCYGDSVYSANTAIDVRGINLGQYQSLIDDAGQALIEEDYAGALGALSLALAAGDEEAVANALVNLGTLLQDAALMAYHRLRFYAPGVVPVQHLLEIDKRLGEGGGSVADDQTPAEVEDITQDDNPIRGPNFVPGRRTWIDLVPR